MSSSGVPPTESAAIAGVVALVTIVGLAAALFAAHRSVSVDPAAALREQ